MVVPSEILELELELELRKLLAEEARNKQHSAMPSAGGGAAAALGIKDLTMSKVVATLGVNMTQKIVEFRKVYQPLECLCCDQIVGYVERKSGKVICSPGCVPTETSKTIEKMCVRENIGRELEIDSNSVVSDGFGATNMVLLETPTEPMPKELAALELELQRVIAEIGSAAVPSKTEEKNIRVRSDTPERTGPGEAGAILKATTVTPPTPVAAMECLPLNETPQRVSKQTLLSNEEALGLPIQVKANPTPMPCPDVGARVKFTWRNMKYSDRLLPGTTVRITYPWAVDKYHVIASADGDDVEDLDSKIVDYVRRNPGKSINRIPVHDEILLAKYGDAGLFYRARVMASTPNGIKVDFIDYGDQALVAYSDVLDISEDLFKEPVYGLKLKLMNIPDGDYKGASLPEKIVKVIEEEFVLYYYEDEIEPDESGEVAGKLWHGKDCIDDIIRAHLEAERIITGRGN